ncbi:hypothetical protein [Photobacterium leiognathi]|uniref:hypothetical protein n=1 Tax=Photobacterium leiognathi TaxID=553611 RepID=UPI0034E95455
MNEKHDAIIPGTLSAFTFYGGISGAISIGDALIGGINEVQPMKKHRVNVQKSKINAYNMQELMRSKNEIDLNNVAAEKYIQMERIASGVTRIQKQKR